MHVCMQLRQPILWVINPLVLAVRYIAVTNVNKIFSFGWEKSRSIGVSNSQVTTGSTKCLGNFTSLDTPLPCSPVALDWLNLDLSYPSDNSNILKLDESISSDEHNTISYVWSSIARQMHSSLSVVHDLLNLIPPTTRSHYPCHDNFTTNEVGIHVAWYRSQHNIMPTGSKLGHEPQYKLLTEYLELLLLLTSKCIL